VEICLVKAKVIVCQETFEARVNFDIVVVVNGVYVAATVVDSTFELSRKTMKTR
jgi:hypothetical protein